MAYQKLLSVFVSFLLVFGCMPSIAFASSGSQNSNASSQNGMLEEGVELDTAESGTSNDIDRDDANQLLQELVNDTKKDTTNEAPADQAGSQGETLESEQQQISLDNESVTITFENGEYFLLPAASQELELASSLKLTTAETPRNDVLSIEFNNDGFATIKNNEQNVLTSQGSALVFAEPAGSESQLWYFTKSETSGYVIKNIANNKVLDISGGNIKQGTNVGLYEQNNTNAQNWTVKEVGSLIDSMDAKAKESQGLLQEGVTYYIETALTPNKVIDVAAASKNDGANVQLYDFNKTSAQQWRFTYDDKGYVTITNVSSGKVLDVKAAQAVSGSNVQQYQSNDSYAQKWIVSKNGDGSYAIESALWADLSLDIASASTSNGANIQIFKKNNSAAQSFNLVSEEAVRADLDKKASQNRDVVLDGVYLINSALSSSKVLDVASASKNDGGNVQLYQSNMTTAQQWEISHDDQGYVIFKNIGSGKVLDVTSASVLPKANVQQYTQNKSYAQKWIVTKNADGSCAIESALWPNICLDVASASSSNGANVQTYMKNDTKAQSFNFIDTKPEVAPCEDMGFKDKYFKIASATDNNFVIDVASGSSNDGANVQLYSFNNTYAQLFQFDFVKTDGEKGYYRIVNAKSGKTLDVDSGNLVNGTNVQQWSSANNDNQLFAIGQNKDGTYTFINKASGLAIDVAGASVENSTNIQGYIPNGSAAQSFSLFEVTDLLGEGVVSISSGLSSSKMVDVASGSMSSGANVQLYSSNGSLAQKWNVTKIADNTYTFQSIRSGMNLSVDAVGNVMQETPSDSDNQKWTPQIFKGMTILENVGTGKVLDIKGASTNNGTNIQVYEANGTNAQLFNIASVNILSSGTYTIQAYKNTKYVVDVTSASNANGANIQLYQSNNSGAQKWNVVQNSDNTFTFKNAANGKSIDLKNASAISGANIQQWAPNNTAAQKWIPEYIDGGGIRLVSAVNENFSIGFAGTTLSNGVNVELQSSSLADSQKFTFEQTTYVPPLPSDQQAMLNRIKGKSSGTRWLIAVDRSTHKVGVFKGSANNWSIQYYWSCVTGAPSTPTITGTYRTTGFKRNALTTDSRAIYCTQIWGGYFFHSILVSESELGKSLSHGCIRLPYSAAQWIHRNIYAGTTVVIYN